MNNSSRLIIAKLLETKRQAIEEYRNREFNGYNKWNSKHNKTIQNEHDNLISEINKQIKEIKESD